MRNTMIAIAATAGFLGCGSLAASAATTVAGNGNVIQAKLVEGPAALVQNIDWYCGPRCQYWRHRRWEQHHRWHHDYYRYGYNCYNGGYRYYDR